MNNRHTALCRAARPLFFAASILVMAASASIAAGLRIHLASCGIWSAIGLGAPGASRLVGGEGRQQMPRANSQAGGGEVAAVSLSPQGLSTIRFCDQFSGADPGARCNAAMNSLPATGGVVYSAAPSEPFLTNPFAQIAKPVTLVLGCGTFSFSTPMVLSSSGQSLLGSGSCTTVGATEAAALDSFDNPAPWSAQNGVLSLNTSSPAEGAGALHLAAGATGAVSVKRSLAAALSSSDGLKLWIKHDAPGANVTLALALSDGVNSSTWDVSIGEMPGVWALFSIDLDAPASTSGALNLAAITSISVSGFANGGNYDLDGLAAFTRNDLVDISGTSAAPLTNIEVGNLTLGEAWGPALSLSYVNESRLHDFEIDGGGGTGALQLSESSRNQLDDFSVRNSSFSGVHLLGGSDYNVLTNFDADTSVGGAVQLGSGVLIEDSDSNTLSGCVLFRNGLSAGSGFDLLNSGSYNQVSCSSDQNGDDGFRLAASAAGTVQIGNSFYGAEASGNLGYGFAAIGFSPADLVEDLRVRGNFSGNGGPNGDGVYLVNVAYGRFDITASSNQRHGVDFDSSGSTGSTGNVARVSVRGNGVSGGGAGVFIGSGVAGTQVWLDAAAGNHDGPVQDSGSGTRVHSATTDASVLTAAAAGTCPSSTIVYPWGAGGGSTACGDTNGRVPLVIASPGTLGNLTVRAGSAGSTPTSGSVTVWKNGVATALTCALGNTATACSDDAHFISVAAGDRITIQIATGAAETLADLSLSLEEW